MATRPGICTSSTRDKCAPDTPTPPLLLLDGASLIEYALLVALVALASVGVMLVVAGSLRSAFEMVVAGFQ